MLRREKQTIKKITEKEKKRRKKFLKKTFKKKLKKHLLDFQTKEVNQKVQKTEEPKEK